MPADAHNRRDGVTTLDSVALIEGPDDEGARVVPDLDSRAAIHDLVVHFYRDVVFDDLLEPIFDEVAEVDWAVHMPKLVDYWCRVILGQPGYDGYILASHQHLHSLEPLTAELFDRWYALWIAAVDSGWAGPHAELAKSHAVRIGGVLSRRITGAEWDPARSL